MSIHQPDLMADLVPAKSVAGFSIGEDLRSIQKKIGVVEWHEKDFHLEDKLLLNDGWIGVTSKCGIPGGAFTVIRSLIYKNDIISLEFEESLKLYRVDVGDGYMGSFCGVKVGDSITDLNNAGFHLTFNDMDDDFLIEKGGEVVEGISFLTNYRAALESAAVQTIRYISVHDWSMR